MVSWPGLDDRPPLSVRRCQGLDPSEPRFSAHGSDARQYSIRAVVSSPPVATLADACAPVAVTLETTGASTPGCVPRVRTWTLPSVRPMYSLDPSGANARPWLLA